MFKLLINGMCTIDPGDMGEISILRNMRSNEKKISPFLYFIFQGSIDMMYHQRFQINLSLSKEKKVVLDLLDSSLYH